MIKGSCTDFFFFYVFFMHITFVTVCSEEGLHYHLLVQQMHLSEEIYTATMHIF